MIIIKSNRKSISLSINDELEPVVKAPCFISDKEINSFIIKNEKWIDEAIKRKKVRLDKLNISDSEKQRLRELAKEFIPQRVDYYSHITGLEPSGVKITSAKKRFGSCSGKNSLCFSFYLMSYPEEAIDYVVVHELAHIKHHNHSREFYNLIEQYLPDYKNREKLLKQ